MPENRRKVTLPQGTFDGVDVAIDETTERWTDVTLKDGTTLRVKPSVLTVTRIDGEFDAEGNPMYALTATQVMTVNAPAHLRKGAGGIRKN
jgi:hypothetical protein